MNHALTAHPQLLALLQAAKEGPHEDAPRLVLADWLEDHDDLLRAEFIRLQCQVASGTLLDDATRDQMKARCEDLLDQHGGGWIGPLWRARLAVVSWHRGLLSVEVPRRLPKQRVLQVGPWIDTLLLDLRGRQSLQQAIDLIRLVQVNHVHLDLRLPMREATLLEGLALLSESVCLRSLSICWPLRMLRHLEAEPGMERVVHPAVSTDFLSRLLRDCPLGRHLTHLASEFPFSPEQALCIRELGVEPVHAHWSLWMHTLSPACFHRKGQR